MTRRPGKPSRDGFRGFHRPDGGIGVRNLTLVLSVSGVTGPAARRVGRSLATVRVVSFPFGSGQVGDDRALQDRVLVGMGRHPNVGAVLVIGDRVPRVEEIPAAIGESGKSVEAIALDDCGHDALTLADRGIRAAATLARQASRLRRRPAPLSALTIALECGRSDPSSGLVSNPLMGRVTDRLVDAGGSAVVGETIEWLGAEHLLAARAATPAVAEAIGAAVARRERAAVDAGVDLLGTNPGPTNIAAGLSTIEEKSLGAIAKAGSRPIQGVLAIGEAPGGAGLWVMDAPAYAPESLTGMVASGAQLVLFSTGPGNSFVSTLAPTIKISANPETAERLHQTIDFNAADVFRGTRDPAAAADDLLALVLEVASGTATWGEILDEGDEVISRLGPTL